MKSKEVHLVDYLLVLRRRSWVVLTTFIVVIVVVVIGVYQRPNPLPKFEATATLLVKPDRPALTNIQGGQLPYYQNFDEGVDQRTELYILKSREMLERLVKELDVTQFGLTLDDQDAIYQYFRDAIEILPVGGTYLVNIVARDTNQQNAITLANTMAEVYIEYNLQTKLSAARKTLVWLNEQLVDLQGKIENAYSALGNFQDKNKILAVEMAPEVISSKLAGLTSAYDQAKRERIEAETRLAELQRIRQRGADFGNDLAVTLNDPVLEKLRTEITDAEIERSNLLQSYKDKHPKIVQADLKLETLRKNMLSTVNTFFQKLESDLTILRTREQTALQALESFKNDAVEINNKRLEYSKLKGELTSSEDLHAMLFRQLKETSITENLVDKNLIRLLESARTAKNITIPFKRVQVIGLGMIIGLLLGIGFAFLFEYFDKTLKNPEDVEHYLDLPVLGTIPKIDEKNQKRLQGKSAALSKKKHYALEGGN
ncbi:lipopolysaccharide biosynthesis protein [Candidatus Moduliflexus flocculans]|uniref:Lipopolysaccharide biosynthesis protein n=1 Tax=Candidatus Moduliflexus flocculans TaxID=1499966 RepID=A0A0S6W1D8_9BACT|nr:lipopolysaccharide biosynthesis protein [Candidatus Moduliflexus flocculans]